MDFVLGIILVLGILASLVFPVGLVMLLFPKHRKRGKDWSLNSLFWVVVTVGMWVFFYDGSNKPSDQETAALNTDQADNAVSTDKSDAPKSSSEALPTTEADDVPLEHASAVSTKLTASELMDQRLIPLLDNKAALTAYCGWKASGKAMQNRANTLYGNDNEKWYEYTQEQDAALSNQLSAELGVPSSDWLYYADKHNWSQQCDAQGNQWQPVHFEDLKATSQSSAEKAARALEASFDQLAKGHYHDYLNANNFDEAECTTVQDNGFWYAGCKLLGQWNDGTRSSTTYIYDVAETPNGVVIQPFSTDGQVLRIIEPVIRSLYVLPGTYVGDYPIPDINPASVKAKFERGL